MKRIICFVLALCTVLVLASCKKDDDKVKQYLPVEWVYITGLPDTFPVLCEKVTTVDEIFQKGTDSVAIYWNLLSEDNYNAYLEKIEGWAGTTFGEPAADGTVSLSATVKGEEITVKAAYNGNASGNHLEGGHYDSQARIEVITLIEKD